MNLNYMKDKRAASFAAHSHNGNIRFLTLISIVSAMGGFLFGYETVVIAGTISFVKAQYTMSAVLEGWFVSSGLVGCVAGVMVAGRLSDRYGRKAMLIFSSLLLTVSSVGCGLAPDILWLIVFRVTGGMGVGIASVASPLYISEVSPPRLRGRFVSLFQLCIAVGIVAAMITNAALINYSVDAGNRGEPGVWYWLMVTEVWRGMFMFQALPSVLFFACSLLVPDSPRWLSMTGKKDKALQLLLKLRVERSVADEELERIEAAVLAETGSIAQLLKPGLNKALFLGIFLVVFSELSGITIVMYYGPTILENAGFSIGHSLSGHATIGIVLALCTLLAVWLMDKVGRRQLLLTGIAGSFISLLLIGLAFSRGMDMGYTLVALLCLFVAFFSFSIGPVKWIIVAEIFPTRLRAKAMGIATIALWLTDVVINQLFPVVRDRFGTGAMFFLFSFFLVVHFYVVWKKMPETRNLSLEEIEGLWKK